VDLRERTLGKADCILLQSELVWSGRELCGANQGKVFDSLPVNLIENTTLQQTGLRYQTPRLQVAQI